MRNPIAIACLCLTLAALSADASAQTLTVEWDKGLRGAQRVRDLWRQKDLGVAAQRFSSAVPRHGVVLLKVSPAKR